MMTKLEPPKPVKASIKLPETIANVPFGAMPDTLQNRAIGVVKARLTLDSENKRVGKLTIGELEFPTLINREAVHCVLKRLDLTQEHHFKVYPKMKVNKRRPLKQELCFTICGVRTPDQHTNLDEQDQIFSIAGTVEKVFTHTRKDKKTGEEKSQVWMQVRILQSCKEGTKSFPLLIQANKAMDALEFKHSVMTCHLAGPHLKLKSLVPIKRVVPPVILKKKKEAEPKSD